MNTRDFILIVTGVVGGYILEGVINKNKEVLENDSTTLPNTFSQTVPPTIVKGNSSSIQTQQIRGQETIVDPKLFLCEGNWSKYAQTMRFASEEQPKLTHDNFIASCLAK